MRNDIIRLSVIEMPETNRPESFSSLGRETMSPEVEKIQKSLEAFSTDVSRLPRPSTPPRTTLQVLGRDSLEDSWQRYLAYFIDPTEPHRLGTDAINRVLSGLQERTESHLPPRAPEDVSVHTEQRSSDGNQPDILVHDGNQFFICFELKLYAPEGYAQTHRYVEDEHIGRIAKSQFPRDGHHYVYVRKANKEGAHAKQFVDITWKDIKEWLTPLLYNHRGKYPSRTLAQLSDFLDTIQLHMSQGEEQRLQHEKMRLYLKHREAIEIARSALEETHEYEKNNWSWRFLESYRPETWTENWNCDPRKYGQFYHESWREEGSSANPSAEKRLHFVHLIREVSSFTEGRLTIQLRWPGDSIYKDTFKRLFLSDRFQEQLGEALQEHGIEKREDLDQHNPPRFTEKTYFVNQDELPESYYTTLTQAVREHQQLEPIISEILQAAISEVKQSRYFKSESKDETA